MLGAISGLSLWVRRCWVAVKGQADLSLPENGTEEAAGGPSGAPKASQVILVLSGSFRLLPGCMAPRLTELPGTPWSPTQQDSHSAVPTHLPKAACLPSPSVAGEPSPLQGRTSIFKPAHSSSFCRAESFAGSGAVADRTKVWCLPWSLQSCGRDKPMEESPQLGI